MSVTSDFSSTANDNDARERAERADAQLATLPRSPAEALEPMRPPELPERETLAHAPRARLLQRAAHARRFFTACVVSRRCFYFFKVQFDRPGPLAYLDRGGHSEGRGGERHRRAARARRRHHRPRHVHDQHHLLYVFDAAPAALKAGEYEFRKDASMRQVLDTLVEGKSIDHKVTLGRGADQPADRRAHQGQSRSARATSPRSPREGHAAARHLPVPDRRQPPGHHRAHAGRRRRSSSPRCGRNATPTSWCRRRKRR